MKSEYRKRYIHGAIWAFLLVVAFLLALMAFLAEDREPVGQIELAVVGRYAGYCIFGGLGALFSVAWRIESVDFKLDVGAWEHLFAGLTRIGIGVFAGIIIGLAVHSNFLNLDFGDDPTGEDLPEALFYFLAFIAGFSEAFIPNLLARGEEFAMSSAAEAKKVGAKPTGQ